MQYNVEDAFVLVDEVCATLGTYSCFFALGGQNTLVAKKALELPPQKKPSRGALPLYKIRVAWYTTPFDGFAHGRIVKSKPHKWLVPKDARRFKKGWYTVKPKKF